MIPEIKTGDLVSYIIEWAEEGYETIDIEETALVLGFFDMNDGEKLSDDYSTHDRVVCARILGPRGEDTVLITELTLLSST